jgi:hypothetical protein
LTKAILVLKAVAEALYQWPAGRPPMIDRAIAFGIDDAKMPAATASGCALHRQVVADWFTRRRTLWVQRYH